MDKDTIDKLTKLSPERLVEIIGQMKVCADAHMSHLVTLSKGSDLSDEELDTMFGSYYVSMLGVISLTIKIQYRMKKVFFLALCLFAFSVSVPTYAVDTGKDSLSPIEFHGSILTYAVDVENGFSGTVTVSPTENVYAITAPPAYDMATVVITENHPNVGNVESLTAISSLNVSASVAQNDYGSGDRLKTTDSLINEVAVGLNIKPDSLNGLDDIANRAVIIYNAAPTKESPVREWILYVFSGLSFLFGCWQLYRRKSTSTR